MTKPFTMNLLFIYGDSTLIANKIDTLISQNNENFKELSNAIIASNRNERLFDLISYDTLFTVLITLTIFICGEVIRFIVKKIEKKRQKQETRRFIKYYLDIVIPYVEQIEKEYRKVSQNTTIDSGFNIISPKVLKSSWLKILNIDSRELYNSFKEKDAITKIVRQLDVIDENISTCELYHSKLVISSGEIRERLQIKYRDFWDSVTNFLTEISKNIPADYTRDDTFIYLNNLTIEHHQGLQDNYKNISGFKTNYLRPILTYLVDNGLYRVNPYADKITKEAKIFSDLYFELSEIVKNFNNQYEDYSKNINAARISVTNNIEKIKWD